VKRTAHEGRPQAKGLYMNEQVTARVSLSRRTNNPLHVFGGETHQYFSVGLKGDHAVMLAAQQLQPSIIPCTITFPPTSCKPNDRLRVIYTAD
jgi:hypothetical protein